jgi:hypothetical protein
VADLARRIPKAFVHAASDPAVAEVASDLPDQLAEAVTARAESCGRLME